MHLITMAHFGEAQGVIEMLGLSRISEGLFGKEETLLIITGEGPFAALEKTARTLATFKINRVTNAGLAGALRSEHKLFDVIAVRTAYLFQGNRPAFSSFPLGQQGVDCMTAFDRVTDPETKKILSGFAGVVDRELWGVAFAAKQAGVPLRALKIISDSADSLEVCSDVRKLFGPLSEKLSQAIGEPTAGTRQNPIELPGFHFTFTTRHRFDNLLAKLTVKEEISAPEMLKKLDLRELAELEVAPKERTKRLIQKMELMLDPFKEKLLDLEENLKARFAAQGFSLLLDPDWERPSVTISFDARSSEDLQAKSAAMKQLSLEEFERVMRGDV